ncbi:DNA polymerase III subunit delta' [Corynebacterium hansenii]|uniref:DNA polymerase III subunit delta n=1 Tax=Corynebacterium hansenii TaxID=394964 RepID=A0ABV7ZM92_9CORY|nr:DNA polymerase III subunit delta' [Corynebacterium hansenii]WJY98874.1 DNA polymerase III subunit tau [Corynebacterium hansenii]
MDETGVFDRVTESGGARATLAAAARAARAMARAGDDPAARAAADPNGAMTHSWLFTGPPGSGRSVAAKAFAQALLCTDPDVVGCGRCRGCLTAEANTHGDLMNVTTEGAVIQVKVVRSEVIPWAHRRPTTAEWRVVIIEDADRLNDESANALLKAVEEPPERTVFLLCAPTTDPSDFSVTLRSRCRHVYVPTPTREHVVAALRMSNPELTVEQAEWAGTIANGHIGRAKGLATDEGTREWRGRALDLVEAVFDPSRAYLRTRELASKAEAESKRRNAPREEKELEQLTNSLGLGAKGKGAQAATRGSAGVIKELEENQKRRRKRTEFELVDMALMDMVGLLRDALLVSSGIGADGSGGGGSGGGTGGGAGPTPINPDRRRTASELARRVPPEGLVACIDAVMGARKAMARNVRSAVALDGMMGAMQVACRVGQR